MLCVGRRQQQQQLGDEGAAQPTSNTPALALPHRLPAATSRFRRDGISDVELSRLLHWWQDRERSAADLNGDGLVDQDEAALQVRPEGGWHRCCSLEDGAQLSAM